MKIVNCPLLSRKDGLAAGKGVIIADTIEAARVLLRLCMVMKKKVL